MPNIRLLERLSTRNEFLIASHWEIHPVYRIDVCKFKSLQNCKADNDSVWTRIDQWVPED